VVPEGKTPLEAARLRQRYESGLALAQRYFMGQSEVQKAAERIAARLTELSIPYAICGGLAVTAHGHVRVTVDVDVLLTPSGLARFKEQSLGRGWVERFPGSRGVRDVEHGVPIYFLLTGGFPGDGQPKSVVFPDPASIAVDAGCARVLALPSLIALKLANGMSAPDRPRDLDDVIQLIRANALPADFGTRLDPSVRAKFAELWGYAQRPSGEP
jgi:hypothetical protein